jgi:hypothetical protein
MDEHIARIETDGDHSPITAAAITAVIAELLHEDAVRRAMPARRPRPSAWVAAGRPRDLQVPLPSEAYEEVQWHRQSGSPAGDPVDD